MNRPTPLHSAPPRTRPGVHLFRAADSRVDGGSNALRTGLRHGEVVRVRRGVFASAEQWRRLGDDDRYLATVLSLREVRDETIFCRESAAVIHGLSLIGPWPGHVSVLAPAESHGRRRADVAELRRPPGVETIEIDGVGVTSLRQTVVDLVRSLDLRPALVVADSALRLTAPDGAPMLDRGDLTELLDSYRGLDSLVRARAVIGFADGQAGSPLESISRLAMHAAGLPRPVLQHRFHDQDGFVGETDFLFEDADVIGEADGAKKILDERFRGGRSPARVVLDEKLREDRLRALTHGFARWGWRDAYEITPMLRRLERAGVRPVRPRLHIRGLPDFDEATP